MTTMQFPVSTAALEARARRAARRVGLRARKSNWRRDSFDNYGGFQLVDDHNCIQVGARYDMTPEEVIEYCTA